LPRIKGEANSASKTGPGPWPEHRVDFTSDQIVSGSVHAVITKLSTCELYTALDDAVMPKNMLNRIGHDQAPKIAGT